MPGFMVAGIHPHMAAWTSGNRRSGRVKRGHAGTQPRSPSVSGWRSFAAAPGSTLDEKCRHKDRFRGESTAQPPDPASNREGDHRMG